MEFQSSDFTCCGLSLIDLHSLVDHFEDAHVVVFDSAGNAVYPHPSPILRIVDHEMERPCMSLLLGYPASTVPVAHVFPDTESGFESACDLPEPTTSSEPIGMSLEANTRHVPPVVSNRPICNGKRQHRSRHRKKDKTYKCPVSSSLEATCTTHFRWSAS